MTLLTRRSLLLAISATALTACGPAIISNARHPIADGLTVTGIAAIAKSYERATGDVIGANIKALLTPAGEVNLPALKAAVEDDFTAGRMFVHAGWLLSHTEGQLYTLLNRTK